MSEPKAQYTAKFERLEGSRPPVQDDWGWENDEAEDIGANPLDLSNYRGDDVDELRGQIRLLTAALQAAQTPQDGQGEAERKSTDKLVPDFPPLCKHHFDYFPARYHWLDFRCVYCGFTLEPDDLCKMLDAGQLSRVMDTAPIDTAIRARFAEGGGNES